MDQRRIGYTAAATRAIDIGNAMHMQDITEEKVRLVLARLGINDASPRTIQRLTRECNRMTAGLASQLTGHCSPQNDANPISSPVPPQNTEALRIDSRALDGIVDEE